MIGFMYKDFVCAKTVWYLIMAAAVFPVILIAQLLPGQELLEVIVILLLSAYIIILYLILISVVSKAIFRTDEGKNAEAYMRGLPIGKARYIMAKYVLLGLLLLFTMLIAMLAFLLAQKLTGIPLLDAVNRKLLPYLPAVTGLFLMIPAVEFPFYARFGVRAGENIRILLIVFVFFAFLVYIMFGDLTVFDRLTIENLLDFLAVHSDFADKCKWGIPPAALFVYVLSGAVSVKLYEKKKLGE